MPGPVVSGTMTLTANSAVVTFSTFDPSFVGNDTQAGDSLIFSVGGAISTVPLASVGNLTATMKAQWKGSTTTVAAGAWGVEANSADRVNAQALWRAGDALASMWSKSKQGRVYPVQATQAAPPASPAANTWYIVATSATGAWAGRDGCVAFFSGSVWSFTNPTFGDLAVTATGQLQWNGAAWTDVVTATFSSSIIGRNLLMNPTFRINQRGKSGTVTLAAGEYGHDGVRAGASGLTYTFAYSGIDITITITSGSLIMPVEGLMVEGGAYMLSHEGTATARVWQGTGTAGSGSYASVPATGLAATLTAGTQTNVEFTSGTVRRPQLIFGSVARAFERRQYPYEVALCQRYFARMGGADLWTTFGQGFFTSATSGRSILSTPEIMRARPSMTVSDPSLFGVIYGAVTLTPSAITLNRWSGAFSKDVVMMATVTGATVGDAFQLRANNSTSAYLDFSAELP